MLDRPRDALAPLGWSGSRVVWLVGMAGHQSLVTTDDRGNDERPWLRFAVGERSIESVQWSRDLTGTVSRRPG